MEATKPPTVPWLALSGLILGTFVAILVSSSVNVALPKMMSEFGVNADSIQWVVTAYTLVAGVVVPLSGYLCDRFGTKRVYVSALIIFTLGSVCCSLAWNNNSLIVARVLQGLGGGLIMPVVMILIYRIVPREKMGLAMGVFGIAGMVAPAVGPTMGGYIVDALNWQWIFLSNVPVGLAAIFMGATQITETARQAERRPDILGIIICSIACFTLLLALSQGQKEGWTSLYIVNLFIVSGFGFALFVIWEFIFPEPLLELRLLRNPTLNFSLIALSLLTIGLFAGSFLLPLYAQNILGYTPTQTGLLLLPQALAMAVTMPVSGKLFDKFGARPVCLAGLSIAAYYTYQLHTMTATMSFAMVEWILVKRAVGMGLALMPLTAVGLNTVPPALVSQGSAISNFFRQIAASIGIPIMVSVLTNRQAFHNSWLADTVNYSSPLAWLSIKKIQGMLLGKGLAAPLAAAGAKGMLALQVSKEAFVCGIQDTFLVAGIITAVGIPMALFLSKKAEADETEKQKQRYLAALIAKGESLP